jgi:SAM-dependent methyltransferase
MLPLVEPLGPCPGCGGESIRGLHVWKQRKPIIPVAFLATAGCERCGLLFTVPRPTPELLETYYNPPKGTEQGWRNLRGRLKERELDRIEARSEGGRERARLAVAHLLKQVDLAHPEDGPYTGRAAFDFGCGGGDCLDAFKGLGWETTGLEPNAIGQLAARRHQMVTEIPQEPRFDFVVASQVLEHLVDPGATLARLAAATRDGGYLFCTVPDVETLPDHGDLRYVSSGVHINGFTPTAMKNLMRLGGWAPVRAFVSAEWAPFASADGDANVFGVLARRGPRVSAPRGVGFEPAPGALEPALHALREWGRQLDLEGKFQKTPSPAP